MASKYKNLGIVVSKANGMVLTDKGIRSYAKAEIGDTLKKDTTINDLTKSIIVTKAKPVKAGEENVELQTKYDELVIVHENLKKEYEEFKKTQEPKNEDKDGDKDDTPPKINKENENE